MMAVYIATWVSRGRHRASGWWHRSCLASVDLNLAMGHWPPATSPLITTLVAALLGARSTVFSEVATGSSIWYPTL